MKFTRMISFALISVLSVGTLVAVAEVNGTPVNRTFEIEDIKGERSVLEGITLENIIKVDNNSFEKVYVTNDDVLFEKTQFDLHHFVGEEVLSNKDVYRGMNHAMKLETDEFLFAAAFNNLYPYASNEAFVKLAKKDKSTDEVMKETILLSGMNGKQHVLNDAFFEIEDKVYFCLAIGDWNDNEGYALKVYEVNPKTLELQAISEMDLTMPGNYTNVSNIVSDGRKIYTITSNDKEYKLASFDPLINETNLVALPTLPGDSSYIDSFDMNEQSILLNTGEAIFIVDRSTMQLVNENGTIPSFKSDYDYVYVVNQIVKDDIVYSIYEGGTHNHVNDQLLLAYRATDGSILYEGKLPSMVDRGVGLSYSFKK